MKFDRKYTVEEISRILSAPAFGNLDIEITGINEIHSVQPGDIAFVDHPKYYVKALSSKASLVLINKKVSIPEGKAIILTDEPFTKFNDLLKHFSPYQFFPEHKPKNIKIGEGSRIHPSAIIGENVTIGRNCLIMPHVCIYDNTIIGDHVTIHAGTVIGSDGFYFKNRPTHFEKLHSAGGVIIEDHVDIGAHCTIDKGVTAFTRIGNGTKIDNQVQIGHDTVIGKKCMIASQCGISGCVIMEDEVTIWGQVGITSGVTIGEKAVVTAQSGVSKTLEGHKTYAGTPAAESRIIYRELASLRNLPNLIHQLQKTND